jgi:glycosyltransferase involved in cell wall biosynthesis
VKIGFLHLGEPEHGVSRYGRVLAAEARARTGLQVVEVQCSIARDGEASLMAAARGLSNCDVVHIQHSPGVWGGGWTQVRNLRSFVRTCRAPLVATLHDVYPGDTWKLWRTDRRSPARWLKGQRREIERGWPSRLAAARLQHRAQTILVCSQLERERLLARSWRRPDIECIDHFVERRGVLPNRDAARRELGVSDYRVVTLLGFIHPSKGHSLLTRAIRRLPEDVMVVFAGRPSPGNDGFLASLRERAARDEVTDRLRITGFLPEQQQERWLVATDLAVAPFRYFSASGSLSTWISVAKPLLCTALPQIDEYDRIVKGAIATFTPYRPKPLAEAIEARLVGMAGESDPAVARLRDALLVPKIFDRHLEVYNRAAARPASVRPKTA